MSHCNVSQAFFGLLNQSFSYKKNLQVLKVLRTKYLHTHTHAQTECCLSVARGLLGGCDVSISRRLLSLGIAPLWSQHIPQYFKGIKRFAWWCRFIYHNWLFHLFVFSWNSECFPWFYFNNGKSSECVLLSVLCFVLILSASSHSVCLISSLPHLRLVCWQPAPVWWGGAVGFQLMLAQNHWEVAGLLWVPHVAICAALTCRLLLQDGLPVCAAASGTSSAKRVRT